MTRRDQHVTEMEVRAWCGDYLAKALQIRRDRIDDDENFAVVGLDSAESVFMVTALEDWLGLELESEAAIEHPTIAAFAGFVMAKLREKSASQTPHR